MYKTLLLLIFMSFGLTVPAQDKTLGIETALGLGAQSTDGSIGFHLGISLVKPIKSSFSLEAQCSYNLIIEDQLGQSQVNVLFGGRLYMSPLNSTTRTYLHTLVGPALSIELGDDYIEQLLVPSLTTGYYLEVKNMLFGVAYYTPRFLMLKAGYTF